MEIIPVKSKYEKNGKVQIMYNGYEKWLLIDKDEIFLPIGPSKNSFKVNNYYVVLNDLNKLQFKRFTQYGAYHECFTFFTKVDDKIYMIELPISDFQSKKSKIKCNLAEKDKIINGLKKPNTIIIGSSGSIHYMNHSCTNRVIDNLNLQTENAVLEQEQIKQDELETLFSKILGKYTKTKINPDNVDIELYGFKGYDYTCDYAIEFLSDTKVRCTGFGVTMKGKDNYEVFLDEIEIDLLEVLEDLKTLNAFKWEESKCPYDPDRKTLRLVDKIIQIQNRSEI